MKYICLGYMEEKKWDALSESEREAFLKECFAYDEVLRESGSGLLRSRDPTLPARQRGLARTRGPHQADEVPLGDVEIDLPQHPGAVGSDGVRLLDLA